MIVRPPYTGFLTPSAGGGGGAPSTIPDIWAWWEPSREVGFNNGDSLTQLTDQSGNGRHWTHGGVVQDPTYLSNVLNGHAVVRIDDDFGAGARFDGPDMSAITSAHVFIVVRVYDETRANGLWQIGSNSSPVNVFPFFGDIYENALSSARVGNPTGNPTDDLELWNVYEISSITNEWITKINGTQLGSTVTSNTVELPSGPYLGYTGAATLDGEIAGMYLFDAKLGAGDRTTLINYINARFALSST